MTAGLIPTTLRTNNPKVERCTRSRTATKESTFSSTWKAQSLDPGFPLGNQLQLLLVNCLPRRHSTTSGVFRNQIAIDIYPLGSITIKDNSPAFWTSYIMLWVHVTWRPQFWISTKQPEAMANSSNFLICHSLYSFSEKLTAGDWFGWAFWGCAS